MPSMSMRTRLACCLPIALAMGAAVAQQGPRILFDPAVVASTPLPDFSHAGYRNGDLPLPRRPGTVVDVSHHGAIADDGVDDSAAVLKALAAAHRIDGPVTLRFPAGRFVLSEVLLIERSDFVLEGAGQGERGTELYFPRPLRMADKSKRLDVLRRYLIANNKRQVEPKANIDEPFSPYSWSGGFIWTKSPAIGEDTEYGTETSVEPATKAVRGSAGSREVTLAAGASFKAGDIVSLRWYSRDGKRSALLRSLYGAMADAAGARHWENPRRAIVVQTSRIESVQGSTARLGDPLLHDIGPDMPADAVHWRGLREVGIRDIAIRFPQGTALGHHLEEGWNGICISDVFDGWVDSVRITNSDSGVLTYNSANLTLSDLRTDGERVAHYSVHMGSVHNVLVRDLQVLNRALHSLSFNTHATRSVFQRATVWKAPVLDQHAGANHQNLFDAVTVYIQPDRKQGVPTYAMWDGSGAGYWQPGHGRFNTTWNLRVVVLDGAQADETVRLTGLDEGPDARVVSVHGNREFEIDYRPTPYLEAINQRLLSVPSLYDWQWQQRRMQP